MSAPAKAPPSLQQRLLLGVLGSVGLLWLIGAFWLAWDAEHELSELLDAHLSQAAALLVAQVGPEDDDDEPLQDLAPLHRYGRRVAFQVWHQDQLLLRSSNAPISPMSALGNGFETLSLEGEHWRLFATEGSHDHVRVLVAERQEARDEILWAVLRGMLGPLLLGLPLIGVAAWWAVHQGLGPLRSLGELLNQRSPEALEAVRLPRGTPADMAPLLDALNALLGRVATLVEGERRFTADAAHELRTPLAAIRTQAQVALGADNLAERRHALLATLAGCDRATHLVQQLLTLARLEAAGAQPPLTQRLDLASLARQVAADLAIAALDREQQLALHTDADQPVWVQANEALLGMLLRNLLDNALRYSPPGAEVGLWVDHDAQGRPQLQVHDSGPGLSQADCARLGERFFRVLGSGADGSGLGWSIVRRILAVQQAQCELGRSERLGGLRVTVRWPLAPAAANAAYQSAGDTPNIATKA